jgi:hypothetical protein
MRLAAIGLLLLSAPAWAGDMYSFTLEKRDGLDDDVRRGRVFVEGNSYRLELDPGEEPRSYEVAIWKGESEESLFLDPASRTYYKGQKTEVKWPSDLMLWFYSMFPEQKKTVNDVRVEVQEASSLETVSGQPARRHQIRVSYDLAVQHPAETLRGKVTIELVSWRVVERSLLVAHQLQPQVRTLFPEVDGPLNEALAKLRGFPIQQRVTFIADLKQGEPKTLVITSTIRDIKPAETRPELFEIPKGYTYKKPEISAPGLSSRIE